jgi:hypothetical protein
VSWPSGRRLPGPALIVLAAALATAPILLHGSFCGDDFEFHMVSWFDVQQSWRHGILYPHWMASANYGAGEPRFMFYPPLTWMLGAALGFVLPWRFVPIAMVFLFLAGTGLAVRKLALAALDDGAATLAGCAALFSGFALFTAYERTAFAELAGGFWIPLLLLFALSPHRRRPVSGSLDGPDRDRNRNHSHDRNPTVGIWRRALDGSALPLALVVAGCWLSDGPGGVMGCYLLAAVAVAASVLARSWAPLLRATIAAALGIGLPAFYLIPAAWEQRWVDLREAVDLPVFRIESNWLFARHTDPQFAPFDAVLYRASMLAVTMIGVALVGMMVCLVRARRERHPAGAKEPVRMDRRWWIPLALIPAAVLFLQLPASLPVWNLLPKLRFLQYPWRWVLVVEAPMAMFFAAAVWPARSTRRWPRAAVATLCGLAFFSITLFAARAFLRVCAEGDSARELLAAFRAGGGLEGTDEYEPPETDHWKIAAGLPDACFTSNAYAKLGAAGTADDAIPVWRPDQGSCQATATAQVREPEHMRVAMVAPRAGFLVLRLVSYPAWQVTVNGRRVAAADPSDLRDDGLIAVAVPQGPVNLAVDWTTTPDVIAGRCVTGLALVLLTLLGFIERRFVR